MPSSLRITRVIPVGIVSPIAKPARTVETR